MILFLDDERSPKFITSIYFREALRLPCYTESQLEILKRSYRKDSHLVKSYKEAVDFVAKNGLPEMIFFDHDLGLFETGYDFLKWLCNQDLGYFEAYFHSANPIGRNNMRTFYENYCRVYGFL